MCSSSVHDRGVAFPTLVGFAFGLRAVPLPPADAVGFGLRWSARLSDLLQGLCCSFNLGSSSLAWLCGDPSTLFLLLCLPSGFGHPFGSLVSFVTIDRQRKFSFGGVFLLDGSLPFRSGVIVSLRPLSVCHGSLWLVTALFTCLSLSFQYTSSHGFCCCFARCLGCAALLSLWLCAHLRLGQGFSYASFLPFALLWALGILVPVASLLHLGSLPSRWGHPCVVEECLSSIGTKV